jgi:integrase
VAPRGAREGRHKVARGSIKKEQRKDGPRYILTVDLGKDRLTGERRQRRFTYRTKREAERGRTEKLGEIDKGTVVDRSNQTVGELQRHTNATLLLQMGTDPKVVSERLGHSQTSITMDIYHHVTTRQHVEAGDRIGAALFGTGEKQAASTS